MLDSINRMDGPAIDWSQLPSIKRQSSQEFQVAGSVKTQQEKAPVAFSQEDKEKLFKEVEKVNSQLEALNHSLRMKFSEEAEQFYVEVVDVRTREVIDSIPGKHMIDLAAKLKDMIGFFIDEKR